MGEIEQLPEVTVTEVTGDLAAKAGRIAAASADLAPVVADESIGAFTDDQMEAPLPQVMVAQVSGDMAAKVSLIAAAAVTASNEVPEPITLEEAKAHLRVVGTDEDDYIAALIPAVREMAEGRLNRTIRQRTRVALFRNWSEEFVLPRPPFIAIDTITYADEDGQVQTLDGGLYYVAAQDDDAPGVVELVPGEAMPYLYTRRRPISVSYLAGYPEGQVPRAIIQWMLLALGALYQNRESVVTGVSVDSLPEDFMSLLIQQYRVYE